METRRREQPIQPDNRPSLYIQDDLPDESMEVQKNLRKKDRGVINDVGAEFDVNVDNSGFVDDKR